MTEETQNVGTNWSASRPSPLHTTIRASQRANSHASDQAELRNSAARSKTTPFNESTGHPMLSIGVVDQHSFTRGCITQSLGDFDDGLEVVSFSMPEDCLQSAKTLDVILYHSHEGVQDSNAIRIAPIRKLLQTAPVIVLSAAENPELIIEAIESGARGYVPTATTPAGLVVEIIRLVIAGGTFVPPSGLQLQSRIARNRVGARTATNQEFTPRQTAVLNRLTQGKANKTIAYELAMSESTVKVHIRNIMKKMHASNRTEVACRAQAFAQMLRTETAGTEIDQ